MGYESTELWLAMKQTKYKRTRIFLNSILKNANGDMNEAVKLSLDTVCDAVHAEAGTFWFYSRFGDGMIHPRAQFGGKPMDGLFLAPGEGIAGKVIETCEPVFVSDCTKDPRWAGRMDEKTGFVTESTICVPLKSDNNNSFGCIQLINKTDKSLFDDMDMELMEALAEDISKGFVSLNLLSDGKTVDEAAVLFADIRGFSDMCRKLEPVEVADLVNRFLSFVSTIVKDHEGIPNKYIGDCVMAYWTGDDCAEKACAAAKEMMEKADEFNNKLKDKLHLKFGFGIGINVGPAFIGNIGSSVLSDHTVFGNTVNEAAYLESVAPAGSIYVGKSIAETLEDRMQFKKVSPFALTKRKLRTAAYLLEF